jgi:hypothetical protein
MMHDCNALIMTGIMMRDGGREKINVDVVKVLLIIQYCIVRADYVGPKVSGAVPEKSYCSCTCTK